MSGGLCDFFSLIHSRADLVNFGERDFRHGQSFAAFRVDEVDIPQLPTLQQPGAAGLQEFLPCEAPVGIVEIAAPAQLLSRRGGIGRQRHFVQPRAVRQDAQRLVGLDTGQHEIRRPVNGAVAARAGVRKGDQPFDLRRVFLQQTDAHGNSPAFGIARKHAVKGHAVQLHEFIPARAFHKADHLLLVHAGAVAHYAVQLPIQKNAEVQLGIANHAAGIVVCLHKGVGDGGRDHLEHNVLSPAHPQPPSA